MEQRIQTLSIGSMPATSRAADFVHQPSYVAGAHATSFGLDFVLIPGHGATLALDSYLSRDTLPHMVCQTVFTGFP
jgi:hypothetical protein